MKGGYINIDASGLNIIDTKTQTVTGLHEQLSHAIKINKPVFLYNVIATGGETTKVSSIIVTCYLMNNNTIICETSTKEIVVDKNDHVLVRKLGE